MGCQRAHLPLPAKAGASGSAVPFPVRAPGSACCRCSLPKCQGSKCWQSWARWHPLRACRCAHPVAWCLSSLVVLAVKISDSLKMLAQLLCALGSPSKGWCHCKGFLTCALSLLLVQLGKCVCSPQNRVLFLWLSGLYWGHGKVDGFRGTLGEGPGCRRYQRRMAV